MAIFYGETEANVTKELDEQIEFTKMLLEDETLPQRKRNELTAKLQALLKEKDAQSKAKISGMAQQYLPQTLAAGAVAVYWLRNERYRQSTIVPLLAGAGAFHLVDNLIKYVQRR